MSTSTLFAPGDISALQERAIAHDQLAALGDVWISPDVVLEKKVTIPPFCLTTAYLGVNKRDFPEIDLAHGAFSCFEWSVRSCLAQTGLEARFYRGDMTPEMLRDIRKGRLVAIPIHVQSHVPRPIELAGPILRFFWVNDRRRLRHERLREAMRSDLLIKGREGQEWSFGDADIEDDCVRAVEGTDPRMLKNLCIRLPLAPRFHVPKSEEPLRVQSKKDLPGILRKIRKGRRIPDFVIGETAEVRLSSDVVAVINTGVYDRGERHIRSPLIDAGFSGTIRTETLGGLDHIELFLYRK